MARPTYPSDKQAQFMLRLPDGMRDRLKSVAEKNGRSMNAEIISRLEESLGPEAPNYDVGPARERVFRAMAELKEAISELQIAEML